MEKRSIFVLTVIALVGFVLQNLNASGSLEAISNDDYFINKATQARKCTISQETPYHVGELGEKWQFPSDHLPIGINIENHLFACWNILNTDYLHHIISNSQGLKDSLILSCNFTENESSFLTIREKIVIDQIHSLLKTHSVLALQETGDILWETLKSELPEQFDTITTFQDDLAHGDVFVYDRALFEFIDLKSVRYQCHPTNTIMSLKLKEQQTGDIYIFIQSHVPGGPINSEPARKEFAQFLMQEFDSNAVIIIMGDMNRPPDLFLENFQDLANQNNILQPYQKVSIPYPTHVNTHRQASWIDNLFIYPCDRNFRVSEKDTFFPEVLDTIHLLVIFENCQP